MQYYNCLLGAFVLMVLKYVVFPKIRSKYQLLAAPAQDNTALPIQEPTTENQRTVNDKHMGVTKLIYVENNTNDVQLPAEEFNTEESATVKENHMAVTELVTEKNNKNDVQLAAPETNPEESIIVNKNRIAVKKIIYAMSDRNDVHVWFLHKDTMIEIIERCPMKKFKTRFNAFPQFLHCHESFLVNLNDIASWSTTEDRMELQLKSCDKIIPVSRPNQAFIKEILNSHYILKK